MHLKPLKHFGQHYLTDPNYLRKIADALAPRENDCLVEIGPGLGALTGQVLERIAHIHVVEIDKRFIQHLEHQFPDRLTIHEGDAVKFDFKKIDRSGAEKMRIFGNLPYNVSTPLLFHFLEYQDLVEDMLFLLQKEVVDRMVATPGNKTYGRLSVMTQYHCQAKMLFQVPKGAFKPPPKVESKIVYLKPFTRDLKAFNYDHFQRMVNSAFQQRRKTIRNALKGQISEADLQSASIDPSQRPETISVEQYINLSNLKYKAK